MEENCNEITELNQLYVWLNEHRCVNAFVGTSGYMGSDNKVEIILNRQHIQEGFLEKLNEVKKTLRVKCSITIEYKQ